MGKIQLIFKEFLGNIFISIVIFLVVFSSVSLTIAVIIFLLNVNTYIDKKFSSSIPPNVIKVSPRPLKISLRLPGISLPAPKGTYIDEKVVKKIENMKGVKEIHPLLASKIPMQVMVHIFGINYGSDLICIGADYNLLAGDLKSNEFKKMWRKWQPGMIIPVIIPDILYHAYNSSIAEPNSLPKVSREMIIGVKLKLNFGKSSLKTLPNYQTMDGIVVGFTDKIAQICLVLPLKVMKYFNEQFKASSEYIAIYVNVTDHASLIKVMQKIKEMGLIAEANHTISTEILNLKKVINSIINLLILIVASISFIALSFASIIAVSGRAEYYKILRILGTSRTFIALSVILKFALIGFIGGYLSLILSSQLSSYFLTKLPVKQILLITSLPQNLKTFVLAMSTILPACFSLFGIIKLYSYDKLVMD